jgi:hypothetical protein
MTRYNSQLSTYRELFISISDKMIIKKRNSYEDGEVPPPFESNTGILLSFCISLFFQYFSH